MIISPDNITLSFLVVASVTLAVVVVLIWYVYYTKKFKDDVVKLMDEKLEMYLDNLKTPEKEEPQAEEPEPQEEPQVGQKDFVEELPRVAE